MGDRLTRDDLAMKSAVDGPSSSPGERSRASQGEIVAGASGEVTEELSCIEQEFPRWHPWVSSGGRCWATRKGNQPTDPPDWWSMTVDADTSKELREAIVRQEQLANSVGAA